MKTLSSVLPVFISVFLFFAIQPCQSETNTKAAGPKKISVHFSNTSLNDCVSTILKLAESKAVITIDSDATIYVTKTAVNRRWDKLLKEILIEHNLKLTKNSGKYVIQAAGTPKLASSKQTLSEYDQAHFDNASPSKFPGKCTKDNLVTLGYAFAGGANPYSLVGKCVKLKDVKPFQYFNAREALARWRYRGDSGVVYLENKSPSKPLGEARSLLTECIGVYKYGTTIGSQQIIPHLAIY